MFQPDSQDVLDDAWVSYRMQIAGMLIAPVAFVFILYALFMYKKRTIQVRNPLHAVTFQINRHPCRQRHLLPLLYVCSSHPAGRFCQGV